METLKFLLQGKKADLDTPLEVVRTAASWMHGQFTEADVPFDYSECGAGLGTYGYFQICSNPKVTAIALHLKIAEIHGEPYAFAEVRLRGKDEVMLFPFFGEIGTAEGKLTILHYIADFVLSSAPEVSAEIVRRD